MAADASMPGRPPGLEASDSTERAGVDGESADWLARLRSADTARHEAITQLHDMLVRIARREVGRRADQSRISGPELDDIAYQAAADPLLALLGKLDEFRGDSRFTTWAYKFVMFEVSAKVGRHFCEIRRHAWTPKAGNDYQTGSVWSRPVKPSGVICSPRSGGRLTVN